MRQIARRLRDGSLELIEVPDPSPGPGMVSVRVAASVVSSGTERATLEIAGKGLVAKARARPDQLRKAIDRARRDGVKATIDFVQRRLGEWGPLGYSAAGTVIEAGSDVRRLGPGDRVAIAGAGHANHAEIDVVPGLLCAQVPNGVADEDAAFATLGAIAMQGFRRSEATVGSSVAVIGLGLIGQLAVRIASAAGCDVMGVDLDQHLVELAEAGGSRAVLRAEIGNALDESADAVIICASSESDDPIRLAAELARDRAPVVVVGAVRMDLPRPPFYDKELDLRLSRSYGPGRYDPEYEIHGHDYPIGYVRWTEQRNMQAFLDLVASGRIRPSELVTHRFDVADAESAYAALTDERPVAILLSYPATETSDTSKREAPQALRPSPRVRRRQEQKPGFGLIGAGAFATGTLIPGLVAAGLTPAVVASRSGLSAQGAGRQFGFGAVVSSAAEVLAFDDLDLVVVATQHDSHAELAAAVLERGLPLYVEKPLALDFESLRAVTDAQRRHGAHLFVGFNRRYAPLAQRLRTLGSPRLMTFRVNAGRLPLAHWANDPLRGGGRLKGEGCHFIDFLCDQVDEDPVSVFAQGFASRPELPLVATDNFTIQINFARGSTGVVQYAADAPTGPGKEWFETSAPGAYARIDDFRSGAIWDGRRRRALGGRRQDKGFARQFQHIGDVLRGDAEPPDPDTHFLSTLATLAAARSLETGRPELVVQASSERGDLRSDPTASLRAN